MKKPRLNKLTLIVLFSTTLILGFGVWLLTEPTGASKLQQPTSGARLPPPAGRAGDGQGKAEVPVASFDWGTIDYGGGDAVAEFSINNPGSGTLSLSEVSTSCMCTTAQVIINENKSPYFGMHQKSSWIGQVPPGGEAKLKVIFDPAFHGPSGVGPVTRQIVIKTNDPQNPKLEFNLKGTVVK